MDKATIAQLILGTYEHDLFKPFWLPNRYHSQLGYTYLRQKGRSPVACAAVLLHAGTNATKLARWEADFSRSSASLPRALAVASWIDALASASYSLLYDAHGKSQFKSFEQWPAACQNPFSRLPQWSDALGGGRLVAPAAAAGTAYSEARFRGPFLELLPSEKLRRQFTALADTLTKLRTTNAPDAEIKRVEDETWILMQEQMGQLTEAHDVLLAEAYRVFSERTYPPANDTRLELHTKLAANLYHVLLANLPAGHGLGEFGFDSWAGEIKSWPQKDSELLSLLGAHVVTVRLAGLADRFASAVRLNDLQGAKLLADRMRYAFKRRLVSDLGFTQVSDSDAAALADVLCLGESRFALTFLLPVCYACEAETLAEQLYHLHEASWQDVVNRPYGATEDDRSTDSLLAALTRSLGKESTTLRPNAGELLRGLTPLLPAFGIARLDPAQVSVSPAKEAFGALLVRVYQEAQRAAEPGHLPKIVIARLQEIASTGSVDENYCTQCNVAPAWAALADAAFGRGRSKVESLEKFFHAFRDEHEELCQSCAAQRALAHGVTQAGALAEMIVGTDEKAEGTRLTFQNRPSAPGRPGMRLPPLLELRERIEPEDDLVNLGAAFVRRRLSNADTLDRFPTVAYAADRNSNVIMLTLRATEALYQDLDMTAAWDSAIACADDRTLAGLRATRDLRRYYWNADTVGVDTSLRERLFQIPAHLARVLQRQETLTKFFSTLTQRLEAAGVRTLTLEDRYPVGRYLVPAEALVSTLRVLDRSLFLDLLSVHAEDLGMDDDRVLATPSGWDVLATENNERTQLRERALRVLLCSYVPQLVVGTALVFKQKQALYLMLRAEERLQREVPWRPVAAIGLVEMRGTLVDRGTILASYGFDMWTDVCAMALGVDRRSLTGLMMDWERVTEAKERGGAVDAWTAVARANWIRRTSAADVKQRVKAEQRRLGEEDSVISQEIREAAFFLASITRA